MSLRKPFATQSPCAFCPYNALKRIHPIIRIFEACDGRDLFFTLSTQPTFVHATTSHPQTSTSLMSEIDDIFSSKSSSKAIETVHSVSNPSSDKQKKKKRTKRKREREPSPPIATKHQPVPEVVVDRSVALPVTKRLKSDKPSEKTTRKCAKDGDEKTFTDSRGVGPRSSHLSFLSFIKSSLHPMV
jgi:hypothetical protein